jgi:membrane-associated phospholipid phosphatase
VTGPLAFRAATLPCSQNEISNGKIVQEGKPCAYPFLCQIAPRMDFEFKLYRKTLAFLVPYFLGAAFFALLVYITHKAALHMALRPKASIPNADLFFKYYTHLGTGYICMPFVALLLLLRKWKYAASLALSFGSAAAITQAIKHYVNAPRPFQFFEEIQQYVSQDNLANYTLWFVNGVELKTSPSFPSGHATTAFVLFLSFAFIFRNLPEKIPYKWQSFLGKGFVALVAPVIQLSCLFLAVSVAYSRIYLTQHFAADVLVGSLVGVLATCAAFPFVSWVWDVWHRRKDENYIEED